MVFPDGWLQADLPAAARVQQHLIQRESGGEIAEAVKGKPHTPFKKETLDKEEEEDDNNKSGEDYANTEEKGSSSYASSETSKNEASKENSKQEEESGKSSTGPDQDSPESSGQSSDEKGKSSTGSENNSEPSKEFDDNDVAESSGEAPKAVETLDEKSFLKEAQSDLDGNDPEANEVPSDITKYKRKENRDKTGKNKRPLDEKVKRYKHKDLLGDKDVKGCGRPVCAIIDSRPKRFASLCNFTLHLKQNEMTRRLFHLQKGDCADASMIDDFDLA